MALARRIDTRAQNVGNDQVRDWPNRGALDHSQTAHTSVLCKNINDAVGHFGGCQDA